MEQLQNDHVQMLTVLDPEYPSLLKGALDLTHLPAILFAKGDLKILHRRTIAIIGSRKARETSLDFTRETARILAQQGANVISGNAKGVDRIAYEGAMSVNEGHMTVVLPHGTYKLSKSQMRSLVPGIESGHILLLSQFHPHAPWVVSRAMERNNVVTGLAQIVIVAESDVKGGTWEGANGALKREQYVYVKQSDGVSLPGNDALVQLGGQVLTWPIEHFEDVLTTLLAKSSKLQQKQQERVTQPEQTALFIS